MSNPGPAAGALISRHRFRRRIVAPSLWLLLSVICFAGALSGRIPAIRAGFERALASGPVVALTGMPLGLDAFNVRPVDGLVAGVLFLLVFLPYLAMPRGVAIHERGLVVETLRGPRLVEWAAITRVRPEPRFGLGQIDLAWCSLVLPKISIRGRVLGLVLDCEDGAELARGIAARWSAAQQGS